MCLYDNFIDADEQSLIDTFLSDGYVVKPVNNREGLDALRDKVVTAACRHLGLPPSDDLDLSLNQAHDVLTVAGLNDLRLTIYNHLNNEGWFRPTYYSLGRPYLDVLVGNELAHRCLQWRNTFSGSAVGAFSRCVQHKGNVSTASRKKPSDCPSIKRDNGAGKRRCV